MSKKIACLITEMFEDSEYTEPAQAFNEAGHEVVTIEKEQGKSVKGKQGEATVQIDQSIDNVNPQDFDALFLPGGFSPDQLRADDRFVQFTKSFMDEKKPVFAICHGPQLLLTAKTQPATNQSKSTWNTQAPNSRTQKSSSAKTS
jgi:protease I